MTVFNSSWSCITTLLFDRNRIIEFICSSYGFLRPKPDNGNLATVPVHNFCPISTEVTTWYNCPVAYPEIFFGGFQQILLTEGRENRDLGSVAPQSRVPPNLQMGETCIIIIRFLRCIFHGTGNSARLCQNFGIISGGGFEPPKPPLWVRQCNCLCTCMYSCTVCLVILYNITQCYSTSYF
jgi:hypothetical protein